jgi:hypothetical protein
MEPETIGAFASGKAPLFVWFELLRDPRALPRTGSIRDHQPR